jgi:mannose-6-phosphate isomerase-like protein (cupin superfamily)
MPFVDASQIEETQVPAPFQRGLKFVMSPETHQDVEGFSLIYSLLAPDGGGTDFHTHDDSGELMVFTGGSGKAWLAGVEHEVKTGSAMYAPPGVEHKTLNTGADPLCIVCVFVPPVSVDYVKSAAAHAK